MSQAHHFDPSVLREYDIRGVIGDTLSAADAVAIGRAFGTTVRRAGGRKICVGYDGRLSSPELEAALVEGLTGVGLNVLRIGLGPTPLLYFAVNHLAADGGVMITGSHNPPDYNGFKMMIGLKPFFGKQIGELGRLAAAGDFATGPAGQASRVDLAETYIERILQDFDGGPLAVGWDPGNGAAGAVLEALVGRLPGRHMVINGEIDGHFPNHHPDPTDPATLTQLQKLVAEEGLDVGIAFDGDADRIGAIDSQGRIVWGDQLLVFLAREVLAEVPGATIIADVKASEVLFDEVRKMGGKPLMWRTGHSLIKQKMAETGAPLAGEMSGHIFYAHHYYGFDDAIYAALRLLSAISHQGGSLAALYDALPKMVNTPELRFPCPEERKFAVPEEVRAHLAAQGAKVNNIDGVRVTTDDGWWLLRASNTQAVLVARCEASSEAGLARLKASLADELRHAGITPPDL